MSYICTGSDGFTLPVICHCQLVPGFGCHIRDVAWGVTVPVEVGRLGAEGDGTVADVAVTDERGFGDDSRVGDEKRDATEGDQQPSGERHQSLESRLVRNHSTVRARPVARSSGTMSGKHA